MGKLIKTNPQICMRCCYHMGFGSQPGREQKDAGHYKNIACNYLEIAGHPRVITPDGPAYDSEYCDKFREGPIISNGWSRDTMTMWVDANKKKEEFRRYEENCFY